jgi:uncharacterized membrane protein YsdA (DUF1294 family)
LVSQLVWAYLLVINAAGFLLMGFDKLSAKIDSGRIPEMWFFLISLAGAFLGIVLGMFAFHHKTRKTSFQIKVVIAAGLLALAVALLALRI